MSLWTKSLFQNDAAVWVETTLKFLSFSKKSQTSLILAGTQYQPHLTRSIKPSLDNLFKYSLAFGSMLFTDFTLTKLPLKGLNFSLNSVKYSGIDVHLLLLFGKLLKDIRSPFELFWQTPLFMQRARIRQKHVKSVK